MTIDESLKINDSVTYDSRNDYPNDIFGWKVDELYRYVNAAPFFMLFVAICLDIMIISKFNSWGDSLKSKNKSKEFKI